MEILSQIHSVWRYAVLLVAIGAIALSALAYLGSRNWDDLTERFSMFFPIAMDIEVVIGILVWIFGVWDRNDTLRMVVHPLLMLGAVGLAHVGRVRSDRAVDSKSKGAQATLFYVASLVVVLIAIPLNAWP